MLTQLLALCNQDNPLNLQDYLHWFYLYYAVIAVVIKLDVAIASSSNLLDSIS
ncbi:hypothetical protein [Phormidium tenue]|uniref:hypothetical protein n=1 Tax=Phormidium tenue TaxID=126344 RepID=UPI0030DB7084